MLDKQKVIELATASGTFIRDDTGYGEVTFDNIHRLIQLVRDDYRAELLAVSGEPVAIVTDPFGNIISAYTFEQLAAAVLREREEAEHWKNECRKVVRTYVVADDAWDVAGEVEKQMTRRARGGK